MSNGETYCYPARERKSFDRRRRTSSTSSVGGGSINCGVTCTSVVLAFGDTDSVTLTATPTSGSVFVGWSFSSSGGDGPPSSPSAGCSSAGTTCTFGMGDRKQQVTATFNAAAITTTAVNAPTITYGVNGSVTVTSTPRRRMRPQPGTSFG